MTRVFISYARKDGRDHAKHLRAQLDANFTVWQDIDDMPGGDNWWVAIQEAISGADVMVLVITNRALEPTSIVRQEWTYARRLGKHIMPVTFDADIFSKVPRWLSKRDIFILANDHPDYSATWARFLKQLRDPPSHRPIPFMALPLPEHFTVREAKQNELKTHLLDERFENPQFVSVALLGEGGFGKTTLAQAICHDPEILEAFDDGVLWATIGENIPSITDKLNTFIRILTGNTDIIISDQHEAMLRLEQELKGRDCLMILDDVWDMALINDFPSTATTARIITTRHDTIAAQARKIVVASEMEQHEAVQMLLNWLPENYLPSDTDGIALDDLAKLVTRLGEWPLLLHIIGFALRAEVNRTKLLSNALAYIHEGLDAEGLTVFDRENESDRNAALSASMNYSLRRFEDDEKQRLFELAIFREDTPVTETIALRLWEATASMTGFKARQLLRSLAGQFFQMRSEQPGDPELIRFHDKLRQYLEAKLGTYSSAIHSTFLHMFNPTGNEWPNIPNDDDSYLYTNLAYHLRAAGRTDELHRLLTNDDRWMKVQFKAASGNVAYMNDLEMLITSYKDPLSHKQILELTQLWVSWALVYTDDIHYTSKHLDALIWLDRKDEALHRARGNNQNQPISWRLFGILSVYRAVKERERVGKDKADPSLLAELVHLTPMISGDREWIRVSSELVSEFVEIGDHTSLENFLNEIEKRYESLTITAGLEYQHLQQEYAHILAKAGKIDTAYNIAVSMTDNKLIVETLSIIATQSHKQGNQNKTLTLLQEGQLISQSLDDSDDQVEGLCKVANAMIDIGFRENAMELAGLAQKLIEQTQLHKKSYILRDMSEIWMRLGDYRNARRIARKITDQYVRDPALIKVVTGVAALKKFDQAYNLCQEISDDYQRSLALLEVVTQYAKSSHFDKARHLIKHIPSEHVQAQALCILSKELAKADKLNEAQEIFDQARIKTVSQPISIEFKERAFASLVLLLAKQGYVKLAQEILEKISDRPIKIRTLCDLAVLLICTEDGLNNINVLNTAQQFLQQALSIITSIAERWNRDGLLCYVIEAHAKIELFEIAENLLDRIENDHDKVIALSKIAIGQSLHGDKKSSVLVFDKARDIIQALSNRVSRPTNLAATLIILASAYAQTHQEYEAEALFDEARREIREQEGTYYYHAQNSGALAQELAHIGRFEDALAESKNIDDIEHQAETLIAISKYAVQAEENDLAQRAIDEVRDYRIWGHIEEGYATLAFGMARAGRFADALKILGPRWVDDYLRTLIDWRESFEAVEMGLSLRVTQSALQIIGHQRADYQELYEMFQNNGI